MDQEEQKKDNYEQEERKQQEQEGMEEMEGGILFSKSGSGRSGATCTLTRINHDDTDD